MDIFRQIWILFKKDFLLEFRMGYAISGILLYVCSTVFIVYASFVSVEPNIWNILFWVIILFASDNAIVKSFVQENSNQQLYYYTLTDPIAVFLSKVIYNSLLLLLLSFLTWGAFSFIATNPVSNIGLFICALLLGSIGFSITFTFVSAIAGKADNNSTLMAIMSFPLVIPIIMTLIKLSSNALMLEEAKPIQNDILILIGIDLILLGIALVLYPFLWRD
ncbi:MAG: heme exporter protein CcmB [Bacteroidota bacterium]